MGFDLTDLRAAVARHERVTRVVIAAIQGSSPREVGATMLVWDGGQSGTIGGGALEYEAAARARRIGGAVLTRHPLGPELGQCCGGAVTLLTEVYDAASVAHLGGEVIARPAGTPGEMPLSVKRLLAVARNSGTRPEPQLVDGWMVEPVHRPTRPLWLWGAGHVGRAIAGVMAPLPEIEITWIDTAPDRFPDDVPEGVTMLPAAEPGLLVPRAPDDAMHLVLTYSHARDLDLCHRLLNHRFAWAGLIGSATKWARFRSRLSALGHVPESISRITCPIGDPSLGKHPQAIALGVAAELLRMAPASARKEHRA